MRQTDFTPASAKRRSRARRLARRWALGLGCAAGVLAIALPVGRLTLAQPIGPGAERMGEAIMRAREAEDQREQVRAHLEEIDRAMALRQRATAHPDWSILLDSIARSRGEDVQLTSVALGQQRELARTTERGDRAGGADPAPQGEVVGFHVDIAGSAGTTVDAYRFAQRLELLGVFDRVRIEQTKPSSTQGPAGVTFSIRATLMISRARGGAR